MKRSELLEQLAERIVSVKCDHPVRVAIDGPGAGGKTVLADELVEPVRRLGRPVIRASIDGFHNPSEVRYRRGRDSVEGYYADSFNHDAVLEHVLRPLGPGGSRRYRTQVFDFRTDRRVDAPLEDAPAHAVLIFEGVFVLRPELRDHFDFCIYVHTSFDVTIERAAMRDKCLFGSSDTVRDRYRTRYVPGQQMYLDRCDPVAFADVVVHNDDPSRPQLQVKQSCTPSA